MLNAARSPRRPGEIRPALMRRFRSAARRRWSEDPRPYEDEEPQGTRVPAAAGVARGARARRHRHAQVRAEDRTRAAVALPPGGRANSVIPASVDHGVSARGPRARRRAGRSDDRLPASDSARLSPHGGPQSRARRRPAFDRHGHGRPPHRVDYRRYAIVDETMLQEGAERLTAFYRAQSPATNVVPLRKVRHARKTRPVTRPVDRSETSDAL